MAGKMVPAVIFHSSAKTHEVFEHRSDQRWQQTQEGVAFIDLSEGEYVRLDTVGSAIWLLIDGRRSAGEIARLMTSMFNAPSEKIKKDTLKFIHHLKEMEYIQASRHALTTT
jgi:hypothetical protein